MSNKFLNISSGGGSLQNGTADLFVNSITVNNLDNSSSLRTNSVKTIVSNNLEISDVNQLSTQLVNKNELTFSESTPQLPTGVDVKIYLKDDGILYQLDSSGNEVPLSSSASELKSDKLTTDIINNTLDEKFYKNYISTYQSTLTEDLSLNRTSDFSVVNGDGSRIAYITGSTVSVYDINTNTQIGTDIVVSNPILSCDITENDILITTNIETSYFQWNGVSWAQLLPTISYTSTSVLDSKIIGSKSIMLAINNDIIFYQYTGSIWQSGIIPTINEFSVNKWSVNFVDDILLYSFTTTTGDIHHEINQLVGGIWNNLASYTYANASSGNSSTLSSLGSKKFCYINNTELKIYDLDNLNLIDTIPAIDISSFDINEQYLFVGYSLDDTSFIDAGKITLYAFNENLVQYDSVFEIFGSSLSEGLGNTLSTTLDQTVLTSGGRYFERSDNNIYTPEINVSDLRNKDGLECVTLLSNGSTEINFLRTNDIRNVNGDFVYNNSTDELSSGNVTCNNISSVLSNNNIILNNDSSTSIIELKTDSIKNSSGIEVYNSTSNELSVNKFIGNELEVENITGKTTDIQINSISKINNDTYPLTVGTVGNIILNSDASSNILEVKTNNIKNTDGNVFYELKDEIKTLTQVGSDVPVLNPNRTCISDDGKRCFVVDISGILTAYQFDGVSNWNQIGNSITSVLSSALDSNSDGSVIVIGEQAIVRVFEWDGINWNQKGATKAGSFEGNAVSINNDASRFVSCRENEVNVYEWNGIDWQLLGSSIPSTGFNVSVDIDSDLNRVIFTTATGFGAGETTHKVYEYDGNNNWNQLGSDFVSTWMDNGYGIVSMNSDGGIIAIGEKRAVDNFGIVKVFEYQAPNWVQLGNTIVGNYADGRFGANIKLDSDGSIILIGEERNSQTGFKDGAIFLYRFEAVDWVKKFELFGDGEEELGSDLDLTPNGTRFIVNKFSSGNPKVYDASIELGGSSVQIEDLKTDGTLNLVGTTSLKLDTGSSLTIGGLNDQLVISDISNNVSIGNLYADNISSAGIIEFKQTAKLQISDTTDMTIGGSVNNPITISAQDNICYIPNLDVKNIEISDNNSSSLTIRADVKDQIIFDTVNNEIKITPTLTLNDIKSQEVKTNNIKNTDGDVFYETKGGSGGLSFSQLGGDFTSGLYEGTISGNGTRIAFGQPDIQVYEYDGVSNWNQLGSNVVLGSPIIVNLALNDDGNVLLIGEAFYGGFLNPGIATFEYNGVSWVQKGQIILVPGTLAGADVCISNDGNRIGFIDSYGRETRVYEWDGISAWVQLGNTLPDVLNTDHAGISCNNDLSRIIITTSSSGVGSPQVGDPCSFQIYEYDNVSSWIQIGSDITKNDGLVNNQRDTCTMNGDGSIIAITGTNTVDNKGRVAVYEWDGISTWNQLGSDITGNTNLFGFTVNLDNSGTTLMITDQSDNSDTGYVVLYKYDNTVSNWVKETELFGLNSGDQRGHNSSLSGDGLRAVINGFSSSIEPPKAYEIKAPTIEGNAINIVDLKTPEGTLNLVDVTRIDNNAYPLTVGTNDNLILNTNSVDIPVLNIPLTMSLSGTRYITLPEQLGTDNGTSYVLEDGISYVVCGVITVAKNIVFGIGNSIRGLDFQSTITFDETLQDCGFQATNQDFYLSNITVNQGGGRFNSSTPLLSLTNYDLLAPVPFYGRNKRCKITNVNFIRAFDFGFIRGFGTINFTNNFLNGGGGLSGQSADYYTNFGLNVSDGLSLEFNNNKVVLFLGAQLPSNLAQLTLDNNADPVLGFNAVTLANNIFHPRDQEVGIKFETNSTSKLGNISGNTFIRTGGIGPLIGYESQTVFDNYNKKSIINYSINANSGITNSEPNLKCIMTGSTQTTSTSYVPIQPLDNSSILPLNLCRRFGIQLDLTGISVAFQQYEVVTDSASGNSAYILSVEPLVATNQTVYITDMSGTFGAIPTGFTGNIAGSATGGSLIGNYRYIEKDPRVLTINGSAEVTTGNNETYHITHGSSSVADADQESYALSDNSGAGSTLSIVGTKLFNFGDELSFFVRTLSGSQTTIDKLVIAVK